MGFSWNRIMTARGTDAATVLVGLLLCRSPERYCPASGPLARAMAVDYLLWKEPWGLHDYGGRLLMALVSSQTPRTVESDCYGVP